MNQDIATETGSDKWSIYRALRGAKLTKNNSIKLGKFTILKKELIKDSIVNVSNMEVVEEQIDEYFLSSNYDLFVSTEVDANDGKESLRKADLEFQKFDNIIRYMVASIENTVDIGVFDYFEAELSKAICLSPPAWFLSSSLKGAIHPITLDDEFLSGYKISDKIFKITFSGHCYFTNPHLGHAQIWDKASKENQSRLESRIISAIEWLGKSIRDQSISRAYIQVVFALETLFTFQEKGVLVSPSIASQIAEFSAFILGKDFKTRLAVEKKVKAVYAKRSAIVHGGETSITKDEYKEAFSLLQHLILKLVTDQSLQFSSIEDLNEWVKQQKYESRAD